LLRLNFLFRHVPQTRNWNGQSDALGTCNPCLDKNIHFKVRANNGVGLYYYAHGMGLRAHGAAAPAIEQTQERRRGETFKVEFQCCYWRTHSTIDSERV